MAIARVNHAEGVSWNATALTTLSTAAFSATAGNLVVVFENDIPAAATLSDTATNTYILVNLDGTSLGGHFWYAKNILGNASNVVTATWLTGNSFTYLAAVQYSGLDLINPLDTSAWTAFGANPTIQSPFSPTITTRYANEVLVGFVESSSNTGVAVAPFSLVVLAGSPSTTGQVIEDNIVSTIQTNVQATCSEGSLQNWGMGIVAFVGAGQVVAGGNNNLMRMGAGT
jgi:hypothetical protein